jgi:hypothetical protein
MTSARSLIVMPAETSPDERRKMISIGVRVG